MAVSASDGAWCVKQTRGWKRTMSRRTFVNLRRMGKRTFVVLVAIIFYVEIASLPGAYVYAASNSGSSSSGSTSSAATSSSPGISTAVTTPGGAPPPNAASSPAVLNSPQCQNLGNAANNKLAQNTSVAAAAGHNVHQLLNQLVSNLKNCLDGLLNVNFGSFFNLPICALLTNVTNGLVSQLTQNINMPYGLGGVSMSLGGSGLAGGGNNLSGSANTGGSFGLGGASSGQSLAPSYNSYATGNVTDPMTGTNISGSSNANGTGTSVQSNGSSSMSSPVFGNSNSSSTNSGSLSGAGQGLFK